MDLPQTLPGFIWHFIKKQKALFITTQILSLAWSIDNTLWPVAFKLLIDKVTLFQGDKQEIWYYLMPVLIFWASLWLIIDIMFRIQGFLMARVFPHFEADVRMAMFRYVTGHSYTFFSNHFAGSLSNRINDMTQSAINILKLFLTLFIPVLVAFIIAIVIFFTINYVFSLLLILWAILHIGICFLGAKKCADLSHVHSDSRSFLMGKVVDAFSNIINVKIFARTKYEYSYVGSYQSDERVKHRAARIQVEKMKILLGISSLIFPGILMTWYIIYSWQHDIIGVGDLVLILNTMWNIQMLAWVAGLELPNLFKEIGVCQQAMRIIKEEHGIQDKPNAKLLITKDGNIVFNNVTFHYAGNRVFDDFSVNIDAASHVGLVGFSGGGKTTFVNLIMRFFDIESGQICIDDINIQEVTKDSLRNQISMIPQSPTLFHRSIYENIRYGNIDASHDEIIQASKHAHCHEFIMNLPEGYDSLVGERGIKLSGGQRQRIAIARAILENAPILILDEATSALDSITESRIQEALNYLMSGRTTIVIAHRLSTLSEMDRIIVFDNGKIIEDGTHFTLLRQNGHYAKMWDMQAGGFLPDKPSNLVE